MYSRQEIITLTERLVRNSRTGLLATWDSPRSAPRQWIGAPALPVEGPAIASFIAPDAELARIVALHPQVEWLFQDASLTETARLRGPAHVVPAGQWMNGHPETEEALRAERPGLPFAVVFTRLEAILYCVPRARMIHRVVLAPEPALTLSATEVPCYDFAAGHPGSHRLAAAALAPPFPAAP